MCMRKDICDENQFVTENGASCTDNCEIWTRYLKTGERWCLTSCESLPSDWPERPFLTPSGECVAQCEETHDANNVCRKCAEMNFDSIRPVWDPVSESCVPCSETYGTKYWDGETCVSRCRDGYYRVLGSYICDKVP